MSATKSSGAGSPISPVVRSIRVRVQTGSVAWSPTTHAVRASDEMAIRNAPGMSIGVPIVPAATSTGSTSSSAGIATSAVPHVEIGVPATAVSVSPIVALATEMLDATVRTQTVHLAILLRTAVLSPICRALDLHRPIVAIT